jgi:hypothetical protein
MKFKTDQVMKGLYKAFQLYFEQELPSDKKAKLDLTDEAKKKQHKAVKKNQMAIMQLALSFLNESLLNKLNCKKKKNKKWPTGKAHHVMTALIKEYEPEDNGNGASTFKNDVAVKEGSEQAFEQIGIN